MKQRIELAAMILRDGQLWLVREHADARWQLPGGPLESDDADAAMEEILAAHGVTVPSIEEDFLETIHLPSEDGHVVYNIYAPLDWSGEPATDSRRRHEWCDVGSIEALDMHPVVRDAILAALGLAERPDRAMDILGALQSEFEREHGIPSWSLPDLDRIGATPQPGTAPAGVRPSPSGVQPGRVPFEEAGQSLDARTRALAAIATLAATGQQSLLADLVREAVETGASEAEIAGAVELGGAAAGLVATATAWAEVEKALASAKRGATP